MLNCFRQSENEPSDFEMLPAELVCVIIAHVPESVFALRQTSRTMMCRVTQFIFQPGIIPHIKEVRIEKQWVEARKPNWIERVNRNRFSFLSTPMVRGFTISFSVQPKWSSLLALRLRCKTLDAKKRIDLTGVNFEECTRGHFIVAVKPSDDNSAIFARIRDCIEF